MKTTTMMKTTTKIDEDDDDDDGDKGNDGDIYLNSAVRMGEKKKKKL